IIIALAAVSAVAVYRYQRGLKQLELDGIAKEIFVAAQNHLTMAESQGYLGMKEPEDGTEVNPFGNVDDADKGIYYFVVGSEKPDNTSYASPDTAGAKKTVLSLMLPFASVDETVRLGGSYVIRYQKDPGIVLDVFYVERNGRYPYETLGSTPRAEGSDYSLLMSDSGDGYHGSGNKGNRRNASSFNNAVLGWYGGDEAVALPTGTALNKPSITVINEDTLRVVITNPNVGTGHENTGLKLVVKGVTSRKTSEISLVSSNTVNPASAVNVSGDVNSITVMLDDITSGNHFKTLFGGDGLIPGEDIEIYAVAYNNSQITDSRNGQSESRFTNSLFAYDGDGEDQTAEIGFIRHLENLDNAISGLDLSRLEGAPTKLEARQVSDLSWEQFKNDPMTGSRITSATGGSPTVDDRFVPVNSNYNLEYDGQDKAVKGIQVDYNGFGGLFGSINKGDSVSNLKLINFTVAGTTGAGALAGTVDGNAGTASVSNVVAYNDAATENYVSTVTTATVTGSGSVGGLIGSLTGGTVEKSAAALVVSSTGGSAGGLIGSASRGSVSASYSGGHTDGTGKYSSSAYNVTAASGEAGGLIGDAGSAAITNCYSTCSASGATAGGLVGSASGSITSCYATGLVSGTAAQGAFAGALSSTPTDCKYYKIINELPKDGDSAKGYVYLSSVGGAAGETAGISALDEDPSSFNRFAQVRAGSSGASPIKAEPYDSVLTSYYSEIDDDGNIVVKYDLQSVSRLGASGVTPSDFVATHYGDWPSPETWVINTPGGGSGGTTPPAPSGGQHPVNGYFDVTYEGNDGVMRSIKNKYNDIQMVASPNIVEWDHGYNGVLYFTQAGTATLTFTCTGGGVGLNQGETFTVTAEGFVPDPDPVTYSIVLTSSTPTSERHYSITFTNSSDHLMRTRTVTIPTTGTITSVSGSNATITQGANSVTVEYTNNGAGIAASGNAVVYLDLEGSGDFGLVLD
ncbi:MAG: hypothetical protein K5855_02835, partial [Oscillospiraceae bacterium]|nr:hypothetical protein [Oscillospiraceae bacterium]